MFEFQPVLSGSLITMRPIVLADFESLYAVANDKKMWRQHPQKDRYKKSVFQTFFDDAIQSNGALIAVETETEKIIGTSRYHGYDAQKSEIEIGWSFLGRDYWGGRYNGEMKRLMLSHAFKFINNVVFVIGAENIRSQKAVEKIGGVLVPGGEHRDFPQNVAYKLVKSKFNNTV